MELSIEDGRLLEDIKADFNQRYPYLKLEFFRKGHGEGHGSPKSDMITENHALGEIRTKTNEGDVTINETMSVNEVEQAFESKYGIHVQVFRKSGELWLETSATDSWTLKEQNETGAEMG